MNSPDHDPFDALLEQSLQRASQGIDGTEFRIQLSTRIVAHERRMKLVRLLPAGMGLLTALGVLLIARPKFDFQNDLSSLATLWEKSQPELAWLMQPLPGTNNVIILWALLAGMALVFSSGSSKRESAIFRL